MTEKERFQHAFAPLHASPDTMTEVMKMTEEQHTLFFKPEHLLIASRKCEIKN